jgi:hypothetical protein
VTCAVDAWHFVEAVLTVGMKKFSHVVVLGVTVSALAISSAVAESKKADAAGAAEPKISKAEAQRLVVQRNPGANVVSCTEVTVKGEKMWAVSFTGTGANLTKKWLVNEQSGKITP